VGQRSWDERKSDVVSYYFLTIKIDFVSGIRIFPEVGGNLLSSGEPRPLFLLD
jgi:hypothetical protein